MAPCFKTPVWIRYFLKVRSWSCGFSTCRTRHKQIRKVNFQHWHRFRVSHVWSNAFTLMFQKCSMNHFWEDWDCCRAVSVSVSVCIDHFKNCRKILSLECFPSQHLWKLKDACMSRMIGKGKYTAAEWYDYLSPSPISLISHLPYLDNEVTDTFVVTHTKLNRGKSG